MATTPRSVPARVPAPWRRRRTRRFRAAIRAAARSCRWSPSRAAAVATAATVSPPATLACPVVSDARPLDQRGCAAGGAEVVRSAGRRHQGILSAYSCRGMNGNPNAHISEHAFGNALDIAAFVLRRLARRHGRARLARHARGAGLLARRAGRGVHRCSTPCWRPAPTSITTITSTWT